MTPLEAEMRRWLEFGHPGQRAAAAWRLQQPFDDAAAPPPADANPHPRPPGRIGGCGCGAKATPEKEREKAERIRRAMNR